MAAYIAAVAAPVPALRPAVAGALSCPNAPPAPTAAEFPGCTPVPLPRGELDDCELRFEYWDAVSETAWVCEPVSPYHESPARCLTGLVTLIARMRGSPIRCFGCMDLLQRDRHGQPQVIMQADESVYLHPERARLPGPKAMMLGEDGLPDVVLEVDHTTDVRRRKLPQYEWWGFPEVWVEVPDAPSASRPKGRQSGLTIHLLEDGAFRQSPASRAFPGWTAEEIHAALNEAAFSAATSAALERVGRALGEREGTGPDDDPLLSSQRAEARTEARAELARELLMARGIAVGGDFPGVPGFADLPVHAIAAAAAACTSQADFRERLRR